MVRISNVWDRTTAVLGGRFGMLAGIAALTIVVPGAIRDGWNAYTMPAGGGALGIVLMILWVLALIYGMLALTAVASDPATMQADAFGVANTRLAPALGVIGLMALVAVVVLLPFGIMLVSSGFSLQAAQAGLPQDNVSMGALGGAYLYLFVVCIAALFVGARLSLVYPLIVNERLGLGVFARSWRLTKGMTLKIVGVYLLYAIVAMVAVLAASFIVGAVAGLILGEGGAMMAVWLASLAGSIVTAGLSIVQIVFFAQLYLALREAREPVVAA